MVFGVEASPFAETHSSTPLLATLFPRLLMNDGHLTSPPAARWTVRGTLADRR